jgi:Protein of unknown function (DUF1524)
MRRHRIAIANLAVAATLVVGVTVTAPAQASSLQTVKLRTAIKHLTVRAHSHTGSYSRTKDFGGWISQGHGCDTRAVVLKDESLKKTTQNSNCTIKTGRWFSFYNDKYYKTPYGGVVQIDHVVPVENAWVSGAWRWTKATRVRYYNDLGDARTLVAVDRHDNEVKGDDAPNQWMPADGRCRYIRYYVAVKTRWHLSVTSAEKAALTNDAAQCSNIEITVHQATIHYR